MLQNHGGYCHQQERTESASRMATHLCFSLHARPVTLNKHWLQKPAICSKFSRISVQRGRVQCCTATESTVRLRNEIEALAGEERGIFGMEDESRQMLEQIIQQVESQSPIKNPTERDAVAAAGTWRLLYTNLEILGRKRVKLAIATSRKSGFVNLGEFLQVVDADRKESRNIVHFEVLTGTSGTFTINASYEVESATRVMVTTTGSSLEPVAFEKLLGTNKPLLLQIFDPEGYLDITYLDESIRIGRDNKGHVFVLEKVNDC